MQILVSNNRIITTTFTPTKITKSFWYYLDKDVEIHDNRLVFPGLKENLYCCTITKNPNDNQWYNDYGKVSIKVFKYNHSREYHEALLRFNGGMEINQIGGFSIRIPKGKMKEVKAVVDVIGTKYNDGGKKTGESIKFIRLLGENGKYYSLAQYKWAKEWTDKMVEELESIIGTKLQPHFTGSRITTGTETCSLDKKAMSAMGGWKETSLGLLREGLWLANDFRDFEDIVAGTLLS